MCPDRSNYKLHNFLKQTLDEEKTNASALSLLWELKKCTLKNNRDPGQRSEILYHMEK